MLVFRNRLGLNCPISWKPCFQVNISSFHLWSCFHVGSAPTSDPGRNLSLTVHKAWSCLFHQWRMRVLDSTHRVPPPEAFKPSVCPQDTHRRREILPWRTTKNYSSTSPAPLSPVTPSPTGIPQTLATIFQLQYHIYILPLLWPISMRLIR